MRLGLTSSVLLLVSCVTPGCLVYSSSLLEGLEDGEGTGGELAAIGGADQAGSGGESNDSGGTNTAVGEGSGGVPSTGGSGGMTEVGTGGADAPALIVESVLDDFNDENKFIELEAGRNGSWMAYNDGSVDGVMTPGPGQPFVVELREDTNFALHVVATGFESWGVGYFVSLSEGTGPAEGPGPYDLLAEGYNAVRFLAKRAAGKGAVLRVAIADETSSPSGSCPQATCAYDHAEALVSLQEDWTAHTLLFSELSKKLSPSAELDKAYEFHIIQNSTDIDFWIDDIRFVQIPDED